MSHEAEPESGPRPGLPGAPGRPLKSRCQWGPLAVCCAQRVELYLESAIYSTVPSRFDSFEAREIGPAAHARDVREVSTCYYPLLLLRRLVGSPASEERL